MYTPGGRFGAQSAMTSTPESAYTQSIGISNLRLEPTMHHGLVRQEGEAIRLLRLQSNNIDGFPVLVSALETLSDFQQYQTTHLSGTYQLRHVSTSDIAGLGIKV